MPGAAVMRDWSLSMDVTNERDVVIDKCGADYTIMWRQKASDVVFPDDPSTIRRDLFEGARRLQGCHYQIVLRELQALAGHPDRLHVWTAHAKEAAAEYT